MLSKIRDKAKERALALPVILPGEDVSPQKYPYHSSALPRTASTQNVDTTKMTSRRGTYRKTARTVSPRSIVTLHEEIVDILKEHREEWLKTSEIAVLVNQRGRYRKKDGSEVAASQISARTRKYPEFFDKDGSLVRLSAS